MSAGGDERRVRAAKRRWLTVSAVGALVLLLLVGMLEAYRLALRRLDTGGPRLLYRVVPQGADAADRLRVARECAAAVRQRVGLPGVLVRTLHEGEQLEVRLPPVSSAQVAEVRRRIETPESPTAGLEFVELLAAPSGRSPD